MTDLTPRINELGYQMVNLDILRYLGLSEEVPTIKKANQWSIRAEISAFGDKFVFPPEPANIPGLNLDLPSVSDDIVRHIDGFTAEIWQSYRDRLIAFLNSGLPKLPPASIIQKTSGWTRYAHKPQVVEPNTTSFELGFNHGQAVDAWEVTHVPYPIENTLIFDCETYVKMGGTPVMASAVSDKAWYIWLHPSLANPSLDYKPQLISLGTGKLIVNHFVKYDSARIQETYDKTLATPVEDGPKANLFFDTMSTHIAVCGMSSKQRDAYTLAKCGKFTPEWASKTCPIGLIDCYNHHVQPLVKLTAADKTKRNVFVTARHHNEFVKVLDDLIDYALKDSKYTFELAQALIPKYFQSQPSLVTFAGHLILSQSFLPVTKEWHRQINQIELTHADLEKRLNHALTAMAKPLVSDFRTGKLTLDEIAKSPWLSQLDWTAAKTGATKGLPLWWRKVKSKITAKSRVAPVLLGMAWNIGTPKNPELSPLVYHSKHGWIFKCPREYPLAFELPEGVYGLAHFGPGYYAKVPHKKGDKNNVGSPLSKDYISAIDQGLLCSANERTQKFLEMARSCAYWTSMRKRVFDYFTNPLKYQETPNEPWLMIEPALVMHGTSSRRCVESLWLTVSGAKPNVVGSELKGLVQPPPGWVMVGADFDAQELKIAAAFSDAYRYLIHGSTAMSYTQLLGDKSKGTDGHSLLAQFIKMPRDLAKTLNFQMLYLSGIAGCAMTIKSQRPELSEAECRAISKQALALRRGKREKHSNGNYTYEGGTDSSAYNFMLALANAKTMPHHLSHLSIDSNPRTPALKSSMSLAIQERYCGSDYLTSRANWGIQSSGVDILHLFLGCLYYLKRHYKLAFKFMFSYHDEIWTISPFDERYMTAYCFQIAHLWTWAYFFKSLGFNDLPWNYQFFSSVNIDYCFRKEVYQSQITPSNPEPNIPDGESLDIFKLIEKLGSRE